MGFIERIRAEGYEEGWALTIIKLLTLRFGALTPDVEARVRAAEHAERLAWIDRVFDAESLDDVFTA